MGNIPTFLIHSLWSTFSTSLLQLYISKEVVYSNNRVSLLPSTPILHLIDILFSFEHLSVYVVTYRCVSKDITLTEKYVLYHIFKNFCE